MILETHDVRHKVSRYKRDLMTQNPDFGYLVSERLGLSILSLSHPLNLWKTLISTLLKLLSIFEIFEEFFGGL